MICHQYLQLDPHIQLLRFMFQGQLLTTLKWRELGQAVQDVLAAGWCPGQECSWLPLREDLSAVTGGALLLE